jgi:hypothetical protein
MSALRLQVQQTGFRVYPLSFQCGSSRGGKGQDVMQANRLHLLPRLRMHGTLLTGLPYVFVVLNQRNNFILVLSSKICQELHHAADALPISLPTHTRIRAVQQRNRGSILDRGKNRTILSPRVEPFLRR